MGIYTKIFDAIESALEAAGFVIEEGDYDTVYFRDEDGCSFKIEVSELYDLESDGDEEGGSKND